CEDDMSFDGSCYHDGHDRDEAQLICLQGGGSLAIVSSQAEYDFMVATFGEDTFYVGAQWDVDNSEWVWDDGSTTAPGVFDLPAGDATNSCLMMDGGDLTATSCDVAMGFLCETPETPETPGVCEDDDDMYYDGSCYHTGSDRDEAQLICLQGGGSLAIVSSEEEYDFMVENFGAGTFYVGAKWDVNNNEWVWDDGSTLEPAVLALLDLPDGDAENLCLMMDDGNFTATSCDIAMGFLCETPTVCEDDMSFDGSCYHDGHDRDEAQLICLQGGGSLAIVSSQAEYDFMVATFGEDTFYVGAQWDVDNSEWVWDDGSTTAPGVFDLPAGDATNSCLMMDGGDLTATSCDVALGFLCETPETPETPGVCEDDDDMYYDGSCYHTGSDRDEAQLICLQGGGSLAIVSSEEEYDFMVENFGAGTFYVGAKWDVNNNEWVWDDGSTLEPAVLALLDLPDGDADNLCLMMDDGNFTATSCDIAMGFLCETPTGPESETPEDAQEADDEICENPTDIECREVGTGIILTNGQRSEDNTTTCDLATGAQCLYNCRDYEVRFLCYHQMTICTTPGPTTTPPPTTTTPPPTTTTPPPTTTKTTSNNHYPTSNNHYTTTPTTTTPPPTTTTPPPTTTTPPPTTTTPPPTTTTPPPTTTTPPPTTTTPPPTTTTPPPTTTTPPPTTTTPPQRPLHTTTYNHYTTSNNHYTTSNNHYTTSNDHYTTPNNHYTTSNNHYTTSNDHYTTSYNNYTPTDNHYTTTLLQQPLHHLRRPLHHLQQPLHHLQRPLHHPQQPLHHLQQPLHHLQRPLHHLLQQLHPHRQHYASSNNHYTTSNNHYTTSNNHYTTTHNHYATTNNHYTTSNDHYTHPQQPLHHLQQPLHRRQPQYVNLFLYVCEDDMSFDGSCYHDGHDRDEAQLICQQGGGSLAIDFMVANFGDDTFYVGAQWNGNEWVWDDGTTIDPTILPLLELPDGDADNSCLMMDDGVLTPTSCNIAMGFLCETPETPGVCEDDDDMYYNGSCYHTGSDRDEAQLICLQGGGSLAIVSSEEEYDFMVENFGAGTFYVGAKWDVNNNEWVWDDGSTLEPAVLALLDLPDGDADNLCLMMDDGVFTATSCDIAMGFLCETPTVCEDDMSFDGSCYHDGHDRDEAQLICLQGGGSLAIVSSQAEYDFMVATFGEDTFYVGAQWDVDNSEWVWDDGSTTAPGVFDLPAGDATNSCLMMDGGDLTATSCDVAMGFLCETPETPETPGVCEDDDDMYYDGSCYRTGSDRDEAQLICLQGGGSLAIVSSEEEYDFMVENFGAGTFYVGAKWDVNNNEWVWDDGSTLEPAVLALLDLPDGDADNLCLMMDDGNFTATSCDIAMGFLCETPTGPESETPEDAQEADDEICENPTDIECREVGTGIILTNGQRSEDNTTTCDLATDPNDDERFYELRMKFDFCAEPSAIMCRDANAPGVPFTTGPGLTCDVIDGLYCQADLRPYGSLVSRERETRPETCIGLLGPTPCCLPPEQGYM
ncbi:hypothetical protein Bbelb_246320, partial [Branchiostoma belcheri]